MAVEAARGRSDGPYARVRYPWNGYFQVPLAWELAFCGGQVFPRAARARGLRRGLCERRWVRSGSRAMIDTSGCQSTCVLRIRLAKRASATSAPQPQPPHDRPDLLALHTTPAQRACRKPPNSLHVEREGSDQARQKVGEFLAECRIFRATIIRSYATRKFATRRDRECCKAQPRACVNALLVPSARSQQQ